MQLLLESWLGSNAIHREKGAVWERDMMGTEKF